MTRAGTALTCVTMIAAPALFLPDYLSVLWDLCAVIGAFSVMCLVAFLAALLFDTKPTPMPAEDASDAEFEAWVRDALPELYARRWEGWL